MFEKVLQDYVNQVKDFSDISIGIADENGNMLTSNDEDGLRDAAGAIKELIESDVEGADLSGCCFQKVFIRNKLNYIIFTSGSHEKNKKVLSLVSMNIINLRSGYEEKYDKNIFVKNIMFDEMNSDIAARAKELHISYSAPRVVFIVKTNGIKDSDVYEVMQGLFPNRAKDFVLILDKEQIALIKEFKAGADGREVEKTASIIADTLGSELMVKVYVGVGSIVDNISEIAKSYKEAKICMHVGKIFMEDRYIFSYNSLGLGRLIYMLPEMSCRLFLEEYFKEEAFDFMDSETMLTIQKFFENSLNISETSRQLFVHRNTLVYRLDKIQKLTGLDLRIFDDAITFKIALMVRKYLDRDERI